jgi:hypothetical protein
MVGKGARRQSSAAHPPRLARLRLAYALSGETELAAPELAEARRLALDGRFSSIARLKALGAAWRPKMHILVEATYWAGLIHGHH